MTLHEKHEHMALGLAVLKKLGVTAEELSVYSQALDILKKAEDDQTDPREDAAKLTHYANKDQLLGAIQGLEVANMVEEIISVEGMLI